MKKLFVLVFISILVFTDCVYLEKRRSRELVDNFQEVLKDSKVLIRQIVPPSFKPVPINRKVFFRYDYALISEVEGIEIRYTIHSIPARLKAFEELKRNRPDAILVPPKKDDYLTHFFVNLQNLTGSNPENIYHLKDFPKKSVKTEFGADWGNISYLGLNPDYDKDYQFCELVVLHKDDVADVYIMYLSKDREKLVKFVRETYLFYNVRFL
ncbi:MULTISPECIES: hypothetical protein [Leptospira]|uniref:hypothetical protein n=1 Tax=Leptospira TaxID=171 RepID=UPI0007744FC9|nr:MULTISPECIES: hypothetical protein [Leptospira]